MSTPWGPGTVDDTVKYLQDMGNFPIKDRCRECTLIRYMHKDGRCQECSDRIDAANPRLG